MDVIKDVEVRGSDHSEKFALCRTSVRDFNIELLTSSIRDVGESTHCALAVLKKSFQGRPSTIVRITATSR